MDEVWLLELALGGRVLRFGTERAAPVDGRGRVRVFAPGLEPPEVSARGVSGLGEVAVPVVIDAGVDWAALAAADVLDRQPATLWRWRPDTPWEAAVVVLEGLTDSSSYGTPAEGLEVSVRRGIRDLAEQIPDPLAVVEGETWDVDEIPEPALGATYPLVIGAPGHTEAALPVPVVPVPQAQYRDPRQTAEETFTGYDSALVPAVIELNHRTVSSRVYRTPSGGDEYELLHNVDWYTMWDAATETSSLVIATRVDLAAADEVRIVYDYVDSIDYPGTRSTVAWLGGHAAQVRVQVVPAGEGYGDLEATWATSTVDDFLGRRISVIERPFPLAGGDDSGWGSPEDTVLIGFRDDSTYGGGLVSRRGDLLRGAGDVVEWLLTEQWRGRVDVGRLAAVRTTLNRWKIDCWIDEPINAWDWLVQQLVPLLPIELRQGPGGVYPALVRWDLGLQDVVAHLDTGRGVTRESRITLADVELANEITVKYRPTADEQWLATRVLGGRARTTRFSLGGALFREPDDRVAGSALCAASQSRFGLLPLEVQAGVVWDTATATLIAQHLAARHAWPRRTLTVSCNPSLWAPRSGAASLPGPEVGHAVTITDPETALDAQLAVVWDVTHRGSDVLVDLVCLDSPLA